MSVAEAGGGAELRVLRISRPRKGREQGQGRSSSDAGPDGQAGCLGVRDRPRVALCAGTGQWHTAAAPAHADTAGAGAGVAGSTLESRARAGASKSFCNRLPERTVLWS